ncbi:hypothetical protein GCM10027214_35830 [Stenotrophomonas tumulicola]
MDQHDEGHPRLAWWQRQPPAQHDPTALEARIDLHEGLPLAGNTIEADCTAFAVFHRQLMAIGAVGPSQRAAPASIALPGQRAGLAIGTTPSKGIPCPWADIERAAISHVIAADQAGAGPGFDCRWLGCAGSGLECRKDEDHGKGRRSHGHPDMRYDLRKC